jgi:hypothetical protein
MGMDLKQVSKWIFIALMFIGSAGYAQHAISGKVLEKETGESLPYATVKIRNTTKGAVTNSDGFFTILNVKELPVFLEISYVGFNSIEIELGVDDLKDLILIELEGVSEQLEEVIISANEYKILDASSGVSKSTLSTKQLTILPSIGETDIFRSLQLLPGVSGTNENSSGLFVRGGTPDQNLVLLDGMTVYQVDHFYGFFSAFNSAAIKDVQLYKGAFPAKFGGRTSSVVELTGKSGSFEQLKFGAGLNLLSFNGYIEIPLFKKASFLVTGRRSFTDFLQSGLYKDITSNISQGGSGVGQLSAEDFAAVNPISYFYDLNTKLTYKPSEKDIISISYYAGEDDLDQSRLIDRDIVPLRGPAIDVNVMADIDEVSNWGNEGISGKWGRQWTPRLYSNVLFAGSEFFSRFSRDVFLAINVPAADSTVFEGNFKTRERNSVKDLTARVDFEYLWSDQHKFEFGFTGTRTEVDYSNIRDDTVSILERDQKADYGSIYLSDTWTPGRKLLFSLGVRLSEYEYHDGILFEPRINASYQLSDKFGIKAAYGQHYQFVNRIINENITEGSREFWLLVDEELVDLSKAIHYVAGFSYEIDKWLFDVEGYYKEYSGLSEFSLRFRTGTDINFEDLFFTGSGVAKGVEFLIQKKAGNYTGWTSYTLGSVRNTFNDINNGNEFPALHDQLHEFKMVHTFEYENYRLGGTFIYGSGKPFSEPAGNYTVELLDGKKLNFIGVGDKNGSRIPSYKRIDVSVHYVFDIGKGKGDIGLSVFNLFGWTNTWYYQYDFNQDPPLVTEINYLGRTPNLSISVDF